MEDIIRYQSLAREEFLLLLRFPVVREWISQIAQQWISETTYRSITRPDLKKMVALAESNYQPEDDFVLDLTLPANFGKRLREPAKKATAAEIALWQPVADQVDQLQEQLLAPHFGIISAVIERELGWWGEMREEAHADGFLAMVEGLGRYSTKSPMKFSSYLYETIKHRLQEARAKGARHAKRFSNETSESYYLGKDPEEHSDFSYLEVLASRQVTPDKKHPLLCQFSADSLQQVRAIAESLSPGLYALLPEVTPGLLYDATCARLLPEAWEKMRIHARSQLLAGQVPDNS